MRKTLTAEDQLTMRAAELARSSPENWMRFLESFEQCAARAYEKCVQSTLEELPRSQGRAQAAAHIHGLFRDCLASAAKIEGRKT